MERTATEMEFIDQMTRKLMVDWCHQFVCLGKFEAGASGQEYFNYAQGKGWISKDGSKLTSAGWATASRFLKR